MRLRAPAIAGAAAVLAVALVWYFRPGGEPPSVDGGAEPAVPVRNDSAARISDPEPATNPPSPEAAPVAENRVMPTASVERSPLPGETPSTPLTRHGRPARFMNMIFDQSGQMKSVAYLWREGFAPPAARAAPTA